MSMVKTAATIKETTDHITYPNKLVQNRCCSPQIDNRLLTGICQKYTCIVLSPICVNRNTFLLGMAIIMAVETITMPM